MKFFIIHSVIISKSFKRGEVMRVKQYLDTFVVLNKDFVQAEHAYIRPCAGPLNCFV